MFKDYQKYLSKSLEVYLFVLMIIFILKIVGLDYFGLDVNNSILNSINNFVSEKVWPIDVINYISLTLQFYFYLCIVCKKKKLYIPSLIGALINIVSQILLMVYFKMDYIYYIISFSLMIIFPIIINKKFSIGRQIKYIVILTLYQFLSLFIRNIGIKYNYGNFIVDTILNFDQIIILAMHYNIFFKKGEIEKCQELEVGLSSLKKTNLKQSLQKLLKNFQNNFRKFKKKNNEEKITIIIYIILSFIWNIFSVVLILFVAFLNDTFIECIFILTSFWLSKGKFGKAFHFESMLKCFVVSNLSYYLLNRLTTSLGISIFVPILLGVGLSYVSSKFVKKEYKSLYRGMPLDVFEETILKVTEKNSIKYKICYEFYIEKASDLSLSFKYNYSVAGIRKIKDRINEKIKGLNN